MSHPKDSGDRALILSLSKERARPALMVRQADHETHGEGCLEGR
jgi:hypothetical protein